MHISQCCIVGWLDNAGSFDHLIPLLPNKGIDSYCRKVSINLL